MNRNGSKYRIHRYFLCTLAALLFLLPVCGYLFFAYASDSDACQVIAGELAQSSRTPGEVPQWEIDTEAKRLTKASVIHTWMTADGPRSYLGGHFHAAVSANKLKCWTEGLVLGLGSISRTSDLWSPQPSGSISRTADW